MNHGQSAATAPLRPLRWTDPTVGSLGLGGAMSLPAGTVSFLLTDIAGSTLMWQAEPDQMAVAVARHYEILDGAVATHGGVRPEEQGEGDSVVAAFSRASDAVAAALDAQLALQGEPWSTATPVRVRMAVHTGEARLRDEANYVGMAIIRTARLRAIAHGGQVLVSSASRDLALDQLGDDIALADLGEHRLKDLARPERVYQLVHPGLTTTFERLLSLDATPNNLPVRLSTFIGRQSELTSLAGLLQGNRLVTITGSGGAGKTRLALQVAAEQVERFRDGVWWVELAPLVDPSEMLRTVAAAGGARQEDSEIADAAIVQRLSEDTALVVLDNAEHLIEPVAELVASLVAGCPGVTVLVTSRGVLDVPGEVTWRVPPLALPATGSIVAVERLGQFDAVRLFVDRARRARPTFALSDDNGPAIAEICQRLDGIPLAIELAAARTKSLTPARILDGLGDALRLLTGGSRLSLPRQQTLEASIAWSVDLLADRERTLLSRLSVFSGSFDLLSAEAVCSGGDIDEMDVLDSLDRLIDHSLVTSLDDGRDGRFTLLETVRQFAARQLADEEHTWRERHADHFAAMARTEGPRVETADEQEVIARLRFDIDNLRSALQWLKELPDPEPLAAMVCDLAPFWDLGLHFAEAIEWFGRALEALPDRPSPLRGRLLAHRGEARYAIADFVGYGDSEKAVAIGEQTGDDISLGRGLWTLAAFYGFIDLEAFVPLSDRCLAVLDSAGDRYAAADATYWRAVPYGLRGHLTEARQRLDDAWPRIEAIGNPSLLASYAFYDALTVLYAGDPMRALQIAESSLDLWRDKSVAVSFLAIVGAALCAGVEHPLVDALPDLIHAARRNGEMQRAAGLEAWEIERLLSVDPARALALAERMISEASGLVPAYDCVAHTHAVAAELACGNDDRAWERLSVADELARAGSSSVSAIPNALMRALILSRRGEHSASESAVHGALELVQQHGLWLMLPPVVEMLAVQAAAAGDDLRAARLGAAVPAMRERMCIVGPRHPLDDEFDAAIARVRARMGPDFDVPAAVGAALSNDDVLAYMRRSRGERSRPTTGWDALTPTELQVVELVRTGCTNKEVATRLLMGVETVKTHMSHVFTKLGVSNRSQLTAVATSRSIGPDR